MEENSYSLQPVFAKKLEILKNVIDKKIVGSAPKNRLKLLRKNVIIIETLGKGEKNEQK